MGLSFNNSDEDPLLSKAEYAKIVSEINTDYFAVYENHRNAVHFSVGLDNRYYAYYFINNGFDDYVFVGKVPF